MKFSQRAGITPIQKLAQHDSIDEELKNSLWNMMYLCYWKSFKSPDLHNSLTIKGSNLESMIFAIWLHFFKNPIDKMDGLFPRFLDTVRKFYFTCDWHQIYDFLEFVAKAGPDNVRKDFCELCNHHLEKENSAYRFVNSDIVPITSKEEIEAVEHAIATSAEQGGVKTHLETALALLSNRTNPDYRNSMKESISAIESLCQSLTGDKKATLGQALNKLDSQSKIHPALKAAYSSLYGYTSESDGIRHALTKDETSITQADARYMLIICSAFVNLIMEKNLHNMEI